MNTRWAARFVGTLAGVPLALAALSCAPSEQEIKQEFADFLAKHQSCQSDGDCALISPGCPLGCAVALHASAAAAGEQLARELIEDYEAGGRACQYDCIVVCGAACADGVCTVVAPSSASELTCPQ